MTGLEDESNDLRFAINAMAERWIQLAQHENEREGIISEIKAVGLFIHNLGWSEGHDCAEWFHDQEEAEEEPQK